MAQSPLPDLGMTDSLPLPPSPRRFPSLILAQLPPLHPGSLDFAVGFHDTGIANEASLARAPDLSTSRRALPVKQTVSHGSLPQTSGHAVGNVHSSSAGNSGAGEKYGSPFEATGKSASYSNARSGSHQAPFDSKNNIDEQPGSLVLDPESFPNSIIRQQPSSLDRKPHRRLQRRRSFSTDLDRDAAWEHKRELYQMGCEAKDSTATLTGNSASSNACETEHKICPRPTVKPLTRAHTWSLTDEDLEELRGSIDLGFGFRNDDNYDLKSTLPALELYYAINRQYAGAKAHSESTSPVDGISLRRTCSADSPRDSSRESFQICSPGDHPSQVKTRLRHWAQAVACLIKQGAGF